MNALRNFRERFVQFGHGAGGIRISVVLLLLLDNPVKPRRNHDERIRPPFLNDVLMMNEVPDFKD